ncbi:MAG: hypothetical protein ACK52J_00350 [bacterium]|jgi:hypothetical protein
MHAIGDDFTFKNANRVFRNWDTIIKYINENFEKFRINISYGTPS